MVWKRGGGAAIPLVVMLLVISSIVLLGERDARGDALEDAPDDGLRGIVHADLSIAAAHEVTMVAEQGEPSEDLPPGVVHVDRETAAAHDAALMAEQGGMSVDEAERAMSFQEAFTFFGMEVLLPHYEDQISAIWTVPAPATTAYVRFVDEVPQEVIAEAQARELDIVFQGGGEISMAQHDLRSDLAASALADAGYRNFMVGPDRENGTINIELRVPEGEHLPDEAEIVALVRERMVAYSAAPGDDASLDGRAAEIWPTDIAFAVTVSSEPIAVAD